MDVRQQSEASLDYDGFTTLVKFLLDSAWGSDWGIFTADMPSGNDPTDMKLPVITYSLQGLHPGLVGKTAREIRPRHRFTEKRSTNGNEPSHIKILGQVMDATVKFEVWEESNAKVEKLSKKFRDLMNIYSGFLIGKGLRGIVFEEMTDEVERFRDSIQGRKLTYKLQFEEFTEVPSDHIRVIEMVNQLTQEVTLRT